MTITFRAVFSTAALLLLATAIGCAKNGSADSASEEPAVETAEHELVDDHSGWWCVAHGVPEGECGQCDAKLAAEFQRKGDWCKEHDRPDSQCFICHPELEATFAARYEAKYGKQPPKPET